MAYWRAILPNQILDVRYEVLVTDFEDTCKKLIDFLDLNWEGSVLERNTGQTAVKTLSTNQVRQPVYQTGMGKWRRFERHLGPLIDSLGDSIPDYEAAIIATNSHA